MICEQCPGSMQNVALFAYFMALVQNLYAGMII